MLILAAEADDAVVVVLLKPGSHILQGVWVIPAIVVRESQNLSRALCQPKIASLRDPRSATKMLQLDERVAIGIVDCHLRGPIRQQIRQSVIWILIDDDQFKIAQLLRGKAREENGYLIGAIDRGNDETESGHGGSLTSRSSLHQ